MRSRTELVTTRLEDSEFEDESDFEDSEEDWQPAKGEQKTKKVRSTYRVKKLGTAIKSSSKKQSRKPEKRIKKTTSSDGERNVSADELSLSGQPSYPAKKARKLPKKNSTPIAVETATHAPTPAVKSEPTTSSTILLKPQPQQRDLKEGIINNSQVCLWRRDGSSLLQKYLRDKTVDGVTPQFNSCMVYSCWEDKRADEYLEIKVKCIEQSKQIRVELTNASELESKSRAVYDDYVVVYGIPPPRTSLSKDCNNFQGNNHHEDDDDDDDDDEDDIDDDDGNDDPGDGEGEGSEDTAQEE